jgi:S1-C subfamily serine protease
MSGVKIDKVFEGTAAYDCGLRTGDRVLEVANVKITHPLQMHAALAKQTDSGYAEIKVLRDTQELVHRMPLHAESIKPC